ncbi:pol-like protein [Apostichopus japonicus]|uniref:Pol-like protein n=1 Tax=Stichopus japonicus TaxID=307972 RepID=A0A2G8L1Y4_STIJA|nr:pol-like protein [Apostichopus japonicus]
MSDLHALGVFLDEKLHGARVRARIQFVEADEKPTIRFYRDDTKSVVDRRIRAVCHPGGVVVESPQAVLGDVTSIVTVNGLTSGPFPVRRGVRQGCPLSPLLYVLFSETLSTSLDRCFGFRPFNVPGGARVKCVQYADDVTCIVSDLASFKPLSKVLTTFQEATGARLNKSKTKGLRLGGWRGQSLPFDATWSDVMIKVNGIWLGYGAPEATTWAEKADQVEARLDTFSHRWLSSLGRLQL